MRTIQVLAVMAALGASASAAPDIVRVDGGQISGAAHRGVRVFKGIPYAAPPVGERRWKPPQPVVPWSGVRDATRVGAECPQTQYAASSIYVRPLQPQNIEKEAILAFGRPSTRGRSLRARLRSCRCSCGFTAAR